MATRYDIERRHQGGNDVELGHRVMEACTDVTCPLPHQWSIFKVENYGAIDGFAVWLSDHNTAQLANICQAAYQDNIQDSHFVARPHYIAMNGSYGCIPDSCNVYVERTDALRSLEDLLELRGRQAKELDETGHVACTPAQGAAYCSVSTCTCQAPWEHQDGVQASQFVKECPEFFEEREEEPCE